MFDTIIVVTDRRVLDKQIQNTIKQLEQTKGVVCPVDLDSNQELASKYSIKSIPTLLLFKKGQLVDTKIGLASKKELSDWIIKNS